MVGITPKLIIYHHTKILFWSIILPWFLHGFSKILQGFFKDFSTILQWFFNDFSMILQWFFNDFSIIFQWFFSLRIYKYMVGEEATQVKCASHIKVLSQFLQTEFVKICEIKIENKQNQHFLPFILFNACKCISLTA